MTRPTVPRQLSFKSRLERLTSEAEYFAIPVPPKITEALGTHGPVPVTARVNGSSPFLVSLYPRGGGRHGMRVKASVREEAKIQEGDQVQVDITVIDRDADIEIPADMAGALRAARVLDAFKALPRGKQRYTIRWINEAARPETRAKRIEQAADAARAAACTTAKRRAQ